MNRFGCLFLGAGLLSVLFGAGAVSAAPTASPQIASLGDPFQVAPGSGQSGDSARTSQVARMADGDFVVVWKQASLGGSACGVQFYDADGSLHGASFVIPDLATDSNSFDSGCSQIGVDGNDDLVVGKAVQIGGDSGSNTETFQYYVVRYSNSGVALEAPIFVGSVSAPFAGPTGDTLSESHALAVNANGDFVFAWRYAANDPTCTGLQGLHPHCYDHLTTALYARTYGSDGNPKSDPFLIDQHGPDFQVNAFAKFDVGVALTTGGNAIFAWSPKSGAVQARIYDESGAPLTNAFAVSAWGAPSAGAASYSHLPAVAADGQGNFVISWLSQKTNAASTLYAQRFTAAGTKTGKLITVSAGAAGFTILPIIPPTVLIDPAGNFVVDWVEYTQAGFPNPQPVTANGQYYHADGSLLGTPFQILSAPDLASTRPGMPWLAMDAADNLVATWQVVDLTTNVGTVYAQLFSGP